MDGLSLKRDAAGKIMVCCSEKYVRRMVGRYRRLCRIRPVIERVIEQQVRQR